MIYVHLSYCHSCVVRTNIWWIKHKEFYNMLRVITSCLTPLILPKWAKKGEPENKQGCVSSVHI